MSKRHSPAGLRQFLLRNHNRPGTLHLTFRLRQTSAAIMLTAQSPKLPGSGTLLIENANAVSDPSFVHIPSERLAILPSIPWPLSNQSTAEPSVPAVSQYSVPAFR